MSQQITQLAHPKSTNQLISLNQICGFMAYWVCRQHPKGLVEGVDIVNKTLLEHVKVDPTWSGHQNALTFWYIRDFASKKELRFWLEDTLKHELVIKFWDTGVQYRNEAEGTMYRESIDIDALFMNIAHSCFQDSTSSAVITV